MLILKAFATAVMVAAVSIGILVGFLALNSSGTHSPELYSVVGEMFGIAVGVLFPVFALLFWAKKRQALDKKHGTS